MRVHNSPLPHLHGMNSNTNTNTHGACALQVLAPSVVVLLGLPEFVMQTVPQRSNGIGAVA